MTLAAALLDGSFRYGRWGVTSPRPEAPKRAHSLRWPRALARRPHDAPGLGNASTARHRRNTSPHLASTGPHRPRKSSRSVGIQGGAGGRQLPAIAAEPQLKAIIAANDCFKSTILSWLSHSVAVNSFQRMNGAKTQNAPIDCMIIILYRFGSP